MTADYLQKLTIAAEDAPRRRTLKEAYVIEHLTPTGRDVWWDGQPVPCYDATATVYAVTDDGERFRYPLQMQNPANAYILVRAIERAGSIDPKNWTAAPLAG